MTRTAIVGCGYVGTALATLLAERGHEVYGVRRTPTPSRDGLRFLAADVSRPQSLRWPEGLTHLVYAISADGSTEEAYRAAYVAGLANVLASLAQKRLSPRLLFVGSTGVYHQDDGAWLDEDSPAEPRGFSGRLLLEGEALLHASGLPATVVRLSGIYGPGRERLIDSVRHGNARRVRDSKAVLNHIHRDDCAGAIAHVLSLPNPAPLYLATDNEPAYKNDVLNWIAQQLGVEAPPEVDAEPTAGIHRGGHRFYRNQCLRDSGYTFRYPTYREGYAALIGLPHGVLPPLESPLS
jgi:nucleoside-diphosphate-sugar epimerase